MQLINVVVESTRNTVWKFLGTPVTRPLRTGLTLALGRRRFGQILLGSRLESIRSEVLRALMAGEAAPSVLNLGKALSRPADELRAEFNQLVQWGLLGLADNGEIVSAFPFSATPTDHRVRLPSGQDVHALGALGALGIPLLAGGDGEIHSKCSRTGQDLRILLRQRRITERTPASCCIAGASDPKENLADALYQRAHFFASSKDAEGWLAERRPNRGRVLSLGTALLFARQLFDDQVEPTKVAPTVSA